MRIAEELRELLTEQEARITEREPMSAHTTFGVGGPAEVFVAASTDAAALVRRYCRERSIPFFVVGRGSNLLVPDEGLSGVVLTLAAEEPCGTVKGETLTASAGSSLASVSHLAGEHGLTGLEFAAGIPGSVGGGIVMNAGAYGGELKDVLREVMVLTHDGAVRTVSAEELALSYRSSNVLKNDWVILSAVFHLAQGDRDAIRAEMATLAARRREKQPLEFKSAGSTFKRPEGHFAGKLIEEAGLAGFSIGGAQVSEKHCGFLINRGDATAADIRALILEVQRRVAEHSGVTLEPEVKIL